MGGYIPESGAKLDRVVAIYPEVRLSDFQRFFDEAEYLERHGLTERVARWIGKGMSEYHYNVKVGDGEGAVMIQCKHNSARERQGRYDMRVEFNPQKISQEKRLALGLTHRFALIEGWTASKVDVTLMDIAVDLPFDPRRVMVISKTGREENRYRGDRYYGRKGEHGRIKCYDKKRERKERAGEEIAFDHLTRVEFTWRGRVRLERLESVVLGFDDLYAVWILGGEKPEKAEVRAFIAAIQAGVIQFKELTRTNQRKVKEALESAEMVDFEKAFRLSVSRFRRDLDELLVGTVKVG